MSVNVKWEIPSLERDGKRRVEKYTDVITQPKGNMPQEAGPRLPPSWTKPTGDGLPQGGTSSLHPLTKCHGRVTNVSSDCNSTGLFSS